MKSYLLVFAAALVGTLGAVPLALRLSWRLGAVSHPGGRNVNVEPVGRLGGLAIATASLGAIGLLLALNSSVSQIVGAQGHLLLGLFGGGLSMVALGFADDVRSVRPSLKLLVQLAVAAAAYAAGCRLDWVTIPGVGPIELGALSPLLTALWFVGVINAINLIDGLDGLAAGIVCFAALTNFVVGYLADAILPCLLSAAIAGSTLGFLAHNTHPARIFMGDSGSYFLGFVLAASSLLGFQQKASTAIAIAVPVLSMGVPIFDTLFAMVRRVLRRQPLMSADRGHVHHRLLDMGITHRHVVVVLYAVSALFTGLALMVALQRNRSIGLALAGASLLAIAGWSRVFGRRRRLIQEAARASSRPAGESAPAPPEPPAPTLE